MKKIKIIAAWITGILIAGVSGSLLLSPYKLHSDDFKTVEYAMDIESPIDSVFKYMSNSSFASDWSSFVDHITPLNPDDFRDGEKGSVRRVFVTENEQGAQWDEKIIEVVPNKKRTLTIYNIQGLPLKADGLLTDQRYEKINASKTRLSLVLYFDEQHRGILQGIKMHLAAYRVHSIFKKNLVNIKQEIEARNDRFRK